MKYTDQRQFECLYQVAHNHWQNTGDVDAMLVMDSARQNAQGTFNSEDHPEFFLVALASIQDSIEAYGLNDKLFPWFKKHGFNI